MTISADNSRQLNIPIKNRQSTPEFRLNLNAEERIRELLMLKDACYLKEAVNYIVAAGVRSAGPNYEKYKTLAADPVALGVMIDGIVDMVHLTPLSRWCRDFNVRKGLAETVSADFRNRSMPPECAEEIGRMLSSLMLPAREPGKRLGRVMELNQKLYKTLASQCAGADLKTLDLGGLRLNALKQQFPTSADYASQFDGFIFRSLTSVACANLPAAEVTAAEKKIADKQLALAVLGHELFGFLADAIYKSDKAGAAPVLQPPRGASVTQVRVHVAEI